MSPNQMGSPERFLGPLTFSESKETYISNELITADLIKPEEVPKLHY